MIEPLLSLKLKILIENPKKAAHTAGVSLKVLRQHFPERLISLMGDLQWPARLPNFTPCDYLLWGYRTMAQLKNKIKTLESLIHQNPNKIRQAIWPTYLLICWKKLNKASKFC